MARGTRKHQGAVRRAPGRRRLGQAPKHGTSIFTLQDYSKGLIEAIGFQGHRLPEAVAVACASACQVLRAAGPHPPRLRDELTEVIRLLLRGEAPLELAPHLAGATLHALPKGAGDLRPIAVGETWRRLAGKCLSAA